MSGMPFSSDRLIRQAQERLALQQALVRCMIVRATPTQAAEDRLRGWSRLCPICKEQHRRTRALGGGQ
jgi:hypothetical protein